MSHKNVLGVTIQQLIADIKQDLPEIDAVYRQLYEMLKGIWCTPLQREFVYVVQQLNIQRSIVNSADAVFSNENIGPLTNFSNMVKQAQVLIQRLKVEMGGYSPEPQVMWGDGFHKYAFNNPAEAGLDKARKMFSIVQALSLMPDNVAVLIDDIKQVAEFPDTPYQTRLRLYQIMLRHISTECSYLSPEQYLANYTSKHLAPVDPDPAAEPLTIEWLEILYKQLEIVLMGSTEEEAEGRLDMLGITYDAAVSGTPNANRYFEALSKVCLKIVAPHLPTSQEVTQ